jgi:K+-sensing histidine kinase KdpD
MRAHCHSAASTATWVAVPSKALPEWQGEAAEITEQTEATGSEGVGEGVSHAAAVDADADSEVGPTGHFRIYLGAAPGVGKTFAMLGEGHRRRNRGTDVVIGFVEAYGRPLTEALINGLEVVPRKAVDYRGSRRRSQPVTQIVIGSIQHSWWHIPGGGPILRRVIEEADASGIDVHLIGRREPPRARSPEPSAAKES